MTAWETTVDDVKAVLDAHGVIVSEDHLNEIHDEIDCDAIESGVLNYANMSDQTASALDDIENQLMESGVIPSGEKKFAAPEASEETHDYCECGEMMDKDCNGLPRCPICDGPCPGCSDS